MKLKLFLVLIVIVMIAVSSYAYFYLTGLITRPQEITNNQEKTQENNLNQDATPVPFKIEVVATGLDTPWSLVFTNPNRLLVAERTGSVKQIIDGKLIDNPVFHFQETINRGEAGLMGMAMAPDYEVTKQLYFCLTYETKEGLVDKVIKVTDHGSTFADQTTILDGIPAAQFHAGCRLKFGPDQKLYITTGDATNRSLAQNLESLAGKILRVNPDGSIPTDNPFPESLVYSFGHRNPQGLSWQPETNQLFSTEHGPSGNDGPGGGDEVNAIMAGENYGWPLISHEKSQEGLRSPLLVFTPAEAPASGTFYTGTVFPQFKGNFFFGALRGQGLMRVVFSHTDPTQIVGHEKLFAEEFGRIRDVADGPDGLIYFATSNKDGRGKPKADDDKILRLIVK